MLEITHHPFPPRGYVAKQLQREPYPAPLLTSRDAPRDPVPAPVAALVAYARSQGWTVEEPRQAIGYVPHATHGTPGVTPKVSWRARMRRGTDRAVAVKVGDKWDAMWTWSPTQFFTRHALLESFKEALR